MAKQTNNKPDGGAPPQGNANVTPPADEKTRAAGNETPERDNIEAGASGAANGLTEGNAGDGVPPSVNTTGNETQTPDSGTKPGDAPFKSDSGAPLQGNGDKTGKKKIRHPGKKGKKLFVGARLIQFDADGVAELDDSEAAILLGFEGYEEV